MSWLSESWKRRIIDLEIERTASRGYESRIRAIERRYEQGLCEHCYCKISYVTAPMIVYTCCKGCGLYHTQKSKVCTETPGQKKAK